MIKKKVVILTGLSGAGRSTALKIFEDLGYDAVDNLPSSLISLLLDKELKGFIAIGIDVRSRDFNGKKIAKFITRNKKVNRMKCQKYLIVIFLIFNANLCFAQNDDLQSKITKNLRCLVCQGQSVYDSDSEFAVSLKLAVEEKLSEGMSEKQIYSYFKDKYGDWILYDPKFDKKTYFLWLMPILVFVFGGFVIFKLFIKRGN